MPVTESSVKQHFEQFITMAGASVCVKCGASVPRLARGAGEPEDYLWQRHVNWHESLGN